MAQVFVTGSAAGLGRAAAAALIEQQHEVVVHARNAERLVEVRELIECGARSVLGDLANVQDVRAVAEQVNGFGRMDAVIHNAGVYTGPDVLRVNVVAPYLLSLLIERPSRLVYLSSGLHRQGRAVPDLLDASGREGAVSYADSKLFVTTLAATLARLWPEVRVNSVDPGWVPTRMGGPSATDDLELGHVTQTWLAVSEDPATRTSGKYWYHQREEPPHPSVHDTRFHEHVIAKLEEMTGVGLPSQDRLGS